VPGVEQVVDAGEDLEVAREALEEAQVDLRERVGVELLLDAVVVVVDVIDAIDRERGARDEPDLPRVVLELRREREAVAGATLEAPLALAVPGLGERVARVDGEDVV